MCNIRFKQFNWTKWYYTI